MPAMSPDMVRIVWYVGGFFSVLVVAGLAWWLIKSYAGNGGSSLFSGRERRRLGLMESTSIGGGRHLLLIRRDNVEHLILTGGPIDVVVETGIGKEAPSEILNSTGARPRSEFPRFDQGSSRSAEFARDGGARRLSEAAEGVEAGDDVFHGVGGALGEKPQLAVVSDQKE